VNDQETEKSDLRSKSGSIEEEKNLKKVKATFSNTHPNAVFQHPAALVSHVTHTQYSNAVFNAA
jgi:hypothetical protein